MELSGPQSYIQEASEFWIFVSDFNRNHQIAPNVDITYTEFLQIGAVDVGLMDQNAMIDAESLDLVVVVFSVVIYIIYKLFILIIKNNRKHQIATNIDITYTEF